ncbi:MSMEG_4193 family putative phosphomutase [Williamsia deligens]|uniref:MSMEG_4193 family putative phosphomutase n=1 Tax=Williamsia deligens TaxID=321325 RepID=A0ABW3GG13_9NOCA|nr:MSMEG_4193 family putative phosphomutase [Williamsia deligens]MCP2195233.1 putative phosphomutase, MSMEG_4193 family [Williamsia deligens]
MTVILLRHGRSTANTSGVLAGRSAGVELDETGRGQADAVVDRLADVVDLVGIVRSPLTRCEQTVAPLAQARGIVPIVEDRLVEVDYGSWTGRKITDLVGEDLWKTVQQHPSAAVFPDGEGLADVQCRAVRAIRDLDARLGGPDGSGVWVACTHGDVIKAIVADAMGVHLDSFQRIVVEPSSMSVVRYSSTRPYVHGVNSTGGRPPVPAPPPKPAEGAAPAADDAVIGGSTGAAAEPVRP